MVLVVIGLNSPQVTHDKTFAQEEAEEAENDKERMWEPSKILDIAGKIIFLPSSCFPPLPLLPPVQYALLRSFARAARRFAYGLFRFEND
jgi:hypothetical protein